MVQLENLITHVLHVNVEVKVAMVLILVLLEVYLIWVKVIYQKEFFLNSNIN